MSIKENKFNRYVDCFTSNNCIHSSLMFGNENNVPNPLYSFVVPTYKRPDMLKMALESIIKQTASDIPFEILVLDNNDDITDNKVLEVVGKLSDPRILYYRNEKNLGACGNWNRCVQLARSKWVIFLHDDDLLMPEYLARMDEFIRRVGTKRNIGYIRAGCISFFGDGLPDESNIGRESKSRIGRFFDKKDKLVAFRMTSKDIYLNGGVAWFGAPTYGAVINREAMIHVGGYDEQYSPCADCFGGYKLMREYEVFHTIQPTGYYRWSQNDTYNPITLAGLLNRYEEFLRFLSTESLFVRFFKDCFYYDSLKWMQAKAIEAGKVFDVTTCNNYSLYKERKTRSNMLHLIQKANKGISFVRLVKQYYNLE
ncbi:MAG: glycosyltransferase [Lachnospiraceae bacterium]|nr:glycosyltransferase [Lachnospiraceae bacterium]